VARICADDGTQDLIFAGPGEMRACFRSMDWSATTVGPVRSWSPELRLMIRVCLNSGFPMSVHWGPDLSVLYNGTFIPVLGLAKHSNPLGRPTSAVWAEQWDEVIGPLMDEVVTRARPVSRNNLQLILERNGYPEECYFPSSYNPILDDNGVAVGVSTIVSETTRQVLSERRLRLVQSLGAVSATRADTIADTCRPCLTYWPGHGRACRSRSLCCARRPTARRASWEPTVSPRVPGRRA
jgi:hypothetical protein